MVTSGWYSSITQYIRSLQYLLQGEGGFFTDVVLVISFSKRIYSMWYQSACNAALTQILDVDIGFLSFFPYLKVMPIE